MADKATSQGSKSLNLSQVEPLPDKVQAYMDEHVIPVVQDALVELVKEQPDDPVDALAQILFKKSRNTPAVEGGEKK